MAAGCGKEGVLRCWFAVAATAVVVCSGALRVEAGTTHYTYDVHGRVTTVEMPSGPENTTITYGYDDANNILSVVTQTNDSLPPTVPDGLSAVAVSWQQIELSWSASTEAGFAGLSHYKVYRGGAYVGSSNSATYVDQTLAGNTTYTYQVSAVDTVGNESEQSAAASVTTPPQPDTAPPTAPESLIAVVVGDNWVNLIWNGSTDTGGAGLAGYQIFRDDVQIGAADVAGYSDTTASHSSSHTYKVRAHDGAGNLSEFSNAVTVATPDRTAPNAPSVFATAVSNTTVQVQWAASTDTGGAGLQGYRVYRNGAYLASALSTDLAYTDTSVSGGQTYTYTVEAYDYGSPPNASPQSASPPVTTPPDWIPITDNNGMILPAEVGWYKMDVACDNQMFPVCTTTYSKQYGTPAWVARRSQDWFSYCPHFDNYAVTGYRMDPFTCRVEANVSAYHK
jgi:chitodextrinase